jgi:hypothetical protein
MDCKDWLKLMDNGGGYLDPAVVAVEEAVVGVVMYIFGFSLVGDSENMSIGKGGTEKEI